MNYYNRSFIFNIEGKDVQVTSLCTMYRDKHKEDISYNTMQTRLRRGERTFAQLLRKVGKDNTKEYRKIRREKAHDEMAKVLAELGPRRYY